MSKNALIVAIDNYPSPYELLSTINDLNDLKNTLQLQGFYVNTITNVNATKISIINNLSQLVTTSISGDSIVFAFFGHGSWITSTIEPDGRTECICPVNVFDGYVITDIELNSILSQLPNNVACDVILGNCYSGTGTRSLSMTNTTSNIPYRKSYYIPGPINIKNTANSVAKSISVGSGPNPVVPIETLNHVLWAACKDSQTSWEVTSGGQHRGLFPLYLCWALRNYPTYSRTKISKLIAPMIRNVVSTQNIQLEGPSIELNQLPFM
jgi:hypothetical protein